MKIITRTIWILSLVSLFTDVASEMLYPIMPIYLRSIGFSVALIGILEGVAEATAGLSKGYFGKLSDNTGKRVPFVRLGYTLSAISKPMMAVWTFPFWVFIARTIDRLGKGVRTAARDALLSDEATPATKGTVFGFHRAMDTFGAVLGPVVALIFLHYFPEKYRLLFLLAFFPGLLAILATFLLKEKKKPKPTSVVRTSFFDFVRYWKQSTPLYKRIVGGLLVFTLINSSDMFLLLKIKDTGLNDTQVIFAYIFYNIVYALTSFPLGKWADKIGLKKMLIGGLLLFAIVYSIIGFAKGLMAFLILFFLYGCYAAATEGVSKAWITNIAATKDTATAIGTFTAFQSICTMLASSLTGFLWYQTGPLIAFITSGIVAFLVALYFLFFIKEERPIQQPLP